MNRCATCTFTSKRLTEKLAAHWQPRCGLARAVWIGRLGQGRLDKSRRRSCCPPRRAPGRCEAPARPKAHRGKYAFPGDRLLEREARRHLKRLQREVGGAGLRRECGLAMEPGIRVNRNLQSCSWAPLLGRCDIIRRSRLDTTRIIFTWTPKACESKSNVLLCIKTSKTKASYKFSLYETLVDH